MLEGPEALTAREVYMEGRPPRADASTDSEYPNVIFALGTSLGFVIGGCLLFAVAYYHMPGLRRRQRGRPTWSIPEQSDDDEEKSLHARVELLEQLTREWQAQLVESRDATNAELSEKLSEICGVVRGELSKEAAIRQEDNTDLDASDGRHTDAFVAL